MNDDEIFEGYMDGLRSDLDELPSGSNRSESYGHGWRNGRDDRKQKPRATASAIREAGAEIARREAAYTA